MTSTPAGPSPRVYGYAFKSTRKRTMSSRPRATYTIHVFKFNVGRKEPKRCSRRGYEVPGVVAALVGWDDGLGWRHSNWRKAVVALGQLDLQN